VQFSSARSVQFTAATDNREVACSSRLLVHRDIDVPINMLCQE
jgi:hypothetical protein